LGVEAKAKSVTNNLPLLSVLGVVAQFFICLGSKLEGQRFILNFSPDKDPCNQKNPAYQ
jgi:hypothetical protein